MKGSGGFTLLEVVFATSILMVTLGLLFGGMVSMGTVQEAAGYQAKAAYALAEAIEILNSGDAPALERLRRQQSDEAPPATLQITYTGAAGDARDLLALEPSARASLAYPLQVAVVATTQTPRGRKYAVRGTTLVRWAQ